MIWLTTTDAEAVLLAVFVSALSPTTFAVFVTVPATVGVVTRVIVTFSPAAIVPMLQFRIAPPVQVPFVVAAETKVLPAGIGSATVTPVSVSGPLLVTTIVQVMLLPCSSGLGDAVFVIERSTLNAQDSLALAGAGLLALPLVRVAVLS